MIDASSPTSPTSPTARSDVPTGLPDPARLAPIELAEAIRDRPSLAGFSRSDARARVFSLLRTQLMKRMTRDGARLVGITSATPHAGKSFLSLNLAGGLARVAEGPVHLFDFDFRRPAMARALDIEAEPGIADYLEGRVDDLSAIGRRIEGSSLAIYPTRESEDNSAELLARERFARLAALMRESPADAIVLCDLPPVLAGDDAMLTVARLDAYVMVVDTGITNERQVTEAMRLLNPAPCLGTVLNRYTGGFASGYGYNYGYGAKER